MVDDDRKQNEFHPAHVGGIRVKETETHFIDIVPMIFNHRIVTVPKRAQMVYDQGWCYDSMLAAVAAVEVWDPETEPRPVGWKKEVHTGLHPEDLEMSDG